MTVTDTLDTYLSHWNRADLQGRYSTVQSRTDIIDITLGATGNSPTVHVGYDFAIQQSSAQECVSDALYEALLGQFQRRCTDPSHRKISRRRQHVGPHRIEPCSKSHDWQLPPSNDELYHGFDAWLREIAGIVNLMKIKPGIGGITRATGPHMRVHLALRRDPQVSVSAHIITRGIRQSIHVANGGLGHFLRNEGTEFQLGSRTVDDLASVLRAVFGAGLVIEAAQHQEEVVTQAFQDHFETSIARFHGLKKIFDVNTPMLGRHLVKADNETEAQIRALDGTFLCEARFGCSRDNGHEDPHYPVDDIIREQWRLEDAATA